MKALRVHVPADRMGPCNVQVLFDGRDGVIANQNQGSTCPFPGGSSRAALNTKIGNLSIQYLAREPMESPKAIPYSIVSMSFHSDTSRGVALKQRSPPIPRAPTIVLTAGIWLHNFTERLAVFISRVSPQGSTPESAFIRVNRRPFPR